LFKDDCVAEIEADGYGQLTASVDDEAFDEPVFVGVEVGSEAAELEVECPCSERDEACLHAVAALFAWDDRRSTGEGALQTAAESAVADRVERGKREVEVERESGDGIFGTWVANTVSTDRPSSRPYRVELRSLTERANYCECPDFATNTLGTCKHIEAVLHRVRKEYDLPDEPEEMPRPEHAFVYLDWDVPDAPKVRIRRPGELPTESAEMIEEHFDETGTLESPPIETFHRFERRARDRDDIAVGEDARSYIRRLEEEAVESRREERIREQIVRSNGRIEGVDATLYPYQVEGVAFLASKGRAILADDMGLGKTVQAIAAATWLTQHEGVRHTLVVSPASLKHQWKQEIERFTDVPAEVVDGRPEDRIVQYKRRPRFAIINYALVRRDWEQINEFFAPDLLVLDEAQRIKNWETKTADTIKALTTDYAFVLTGTPLENRLEDLYSLMQVVDERVLGPLWRYMADFHVTDENDNVVGYRNLSELRRRIEPVMLRRDRREVQDQLPERIDTRLTVELGERQRALHDSALSKAAQISQIRRDRSLTPTERNNLMAALQQARMVCDGAQLVDEETEESPKLDELEELLRELCVESGRKVVVFSEWKKMTSRAVERAEELDLGVIELSGDVPTSKRGDLLERFREDPSAQVFVSTDAGGTGLNLQSASVLINLDIPWNPATLEQRIGRVHRLGQSDPVQVVLMVAANSYEERVAALVGQKQSLFDTVVVGEDPDDAVGLSEDALEWIDDSLDETEDVLGAESADDGNRPAGSEPASGPPETGGGEKPEAPSSGRETGGPADGGYERSDEELNEVVASLDDRLGERIRRVLAAQGSLIVIIDEVDEYVEAATTAASEHLDGDVGVVAVDVETAERLEALGDRGPFADVREVEADESEGAGHSERGDVFKDADRRFDSAAVLVRNDRPLDAVELAARALVEVLDETYDTDGAPEQLPDASVWLHASVLSDRPSVPFDVTAATRLFSLLSASSVPARLAEELLGDARRICEQIESAVA